MRGKEDAHDYRYFPEPDLMPLEISREWVDRIRKSMPELPAQKRIKYQEAGLSEYDANVIVDQMETALFFDKMLELGANARIASNFLMGEITAYLKEEHITIDKTKITPESLTQLIQLIEKGTISNNIAKTLVMTLVKDGGNPAEIVEKQGLGVISDENAIKEICQKVVDNNPGQVAAYKGGKQQLFGFFVGQVMKETKGRANPQSVNAILKDLLS